MGIDDIPVGPDMFERWAGPVWGLRIWRVFFGIVVLGIVGGIAFGGWKAYGEIHRALAEPPQVKTITKTVTKTVYVPTPDPKQAAQIADLAARLDLAQKGLRRESKRLSPPTVGSVAGQGNAVSVGQQGGLTVGTVGTLVTPNQPDRHLDDAAKKALLGFIPAKVGIVSITVLSGEGSAERYTFAQDIQQFLRSQGFKVADFIGGYMTFGPVKPGVIINADKYDPYNVSITVNDNH